MSELQYQVPPVSYYVPPVPSVAEPVVAEDAAIRHDPVPMRFARYPK